MVHLSPGMRSMEPYPFEELDRRRKEAVDAGRRLIDFGVGDPREETPVAIREAFAEAIEPVSSYPRAAGIPELRRAIAGWAGRRFGVDLDPDAAILPTLGTKELVFSLAQAVLDPAEGKDLVLVTSPGYPIPERGARFAGGGVRHLPLTEERGFLPDLDALDDATWRRASILWLNYPNNPTGAVAPLGSLRDAAERCREHDVLLASDEAYSELWFEGEPPASALQVGESHGHRRPQHAEQALVDDGVPERVRGGRPGPHRGPPPSASFRRGDAAGGRATRQHRRLGRRQPRGGPPRPVRGEA